MDPVTKTKEREDRLERDNRKTANVCVHVYKPNEKYCTFYCTIHLIDLLTVFFANAD